MTDTRHTREAGGRDELERAQRGDRQAFLTLYELHAPASWRLALVAGRDPVAAEAAVIGSFAHVLAHSGRRDPLRFAPVGVQLLHSARESAVELASRTEEPAGLVAIGHASHLDTLRAYDRLPERWRSVLWLDQLEGFPTSTTAAVVGTSEQSTDALATRAMAGFREQLAHLQVQDGMREHCRYTTIRLAGYAARALPSRDTIRVRRHLDRCEECRARLDDLDDVTPHLRGVLPSLPIAVEDLALGAWLARAHDGTGPIGLRMPSGALAPAWMERTLAGATAAVVSLGISAAVLMGARNGGNPVPAESASAAIDGEQALQGDEIVEEGTDGSVTIVDLPTAPSFDEPTSSGDAPSGRSTATPDVPAPSVGSAPAPRGGAAPSSPSSPPQTSPPAQAPTTPDDPSEPTTPPSSDPVDEVVEVVDDLVDDVCGALGPVCDTAPVESPLPKLGL